MKPNKTNPFSPDYEPPKPVNSTVRPAGRIDGFITAIFVGLVAGVLQLAGIALGLSLLYGAVLLIFRHAFGVELPNPWFWLK